MRIVLDSSVVVEHDWNLAHNDAQAFLAACDRGAIELFVPQVVIDEVVDRYEKRAARTSMTTSRKLTPKLPMKISLQNRSLKDLLESSVPTREDGQSTPFVQSGYRQIIVGLTGSVYASRGRSHAAPRRQSGLWGTRSLPGKVSCAGRTLPVIPAVDERGREVWLNANHITSFYEYEPGQPMIAFGR